MAFTFLETISKAANTIVDKAIENVEAEEELQAATEEEEEEEEEEEMMEKAEKVEETEEEVKKSSSKEEKSPQSPKAPHSEGAGGTDLSSSGYRAGHGRAIAAPARNDGPGERDPEDAKVCTTGDRSAPKGWVIMVTLFDEEGNRPLKDVSGGVATKMLESGSQEALDLATSIFRFNFSQGKKSREYANAYKLFKGIYDDFSGNDNNDENKEEKKPLPPRQPGPAKITPPDSPHRRQDIPIDDIPDLPPTPPKSVEKIVKEEKARQSETLPEPALCFINPRTGKISTYGAYVAANKPENWIPEVRWLFADGSFSGAEVSKELKSAFLTDDNFSLGQSQAFSEEAQIALRNHLRGQSNYR